MKYTIDGLLKEIKRFAEDQTNMMNDIVKTIGDIERQPDPQRRILDSAVYLAVGKMKYDNFRDIMNDISELAQIKLETMRNERNSQDKG